MKYGMKYRGFAPMCQPMKGLISAEEDGSGKYYNILIYDRMLSEEEIREYELEVIK